MFRMIIESVKSSIKHEPHLKPLLAIIGIAPVLSLSCILWSANGKADVQVTRFGDHQNWNSVDTSKPTQVLYAVKSHKAAYVSDPLVENLRKEIYNSDRYGFRRHLSH